MSLLTRLKERKLVQWALAYLACAWLIVQVMGELADRWGIPSGLQRAADVLLVAGFLFVLVLAWYHGERGRQWVTGFELLILAVLMAATAGLLRWVATGSDSSRGPEVEDGRPAVAVLPFDDFSPDPDDAYFASGMHEEVIAKLAQVPALRVVSRNSVMHYQKDRRPTPEIARELGVDFVLEASARVAGDQVRLTAQLVRAQNDEHLWAADYDRGFAVEDLIAVQSDVAREVALAVGAILAPDTEARIAAPPTANTDAYDYYLRGKEYLRRAGGQVPPAADAELALEMFGQATALDPTFARAHAWQSIAHSDVYNSGNDKSPERVEAMRASAERALAIDPESPDGHLARGLYFYRAFRDYSRASRELELASSGLPGEPLLLLLRASSLARQGEKDGMLQEAARARQANPRDLLTLDQLSHLYAYAREYEEAEALLLRARRLAPDDSSHLIHLPEMLLLRVADPDGLQQAGRWLGDFLAGDFDAALTALDASASEGVGLDASANTYLRYPNELVSGLVLRRAGRAAEARVALLSAQTLLETSEWSARRPEIAQVVSSRGRDVQQHLARGLLYAGLSEADDALREGRSVEEVLPNLGDVLLESWVRLDLIWLYAEADAEELALDQLEAYMDALGWWSMPAFAADPRLDGFRDHPRFQALLQKYASEP